MPGCGEGFQIRCCVVGPGFDAILQHVFRCWFVLLAGASPFILGVVLLRLPYLEDLIPGSGLVSQKDHPVSPYTYFKSPRPCHCGWIMGACRISFKD